jgi:hypothetical protein|tara:strand:+ start:379 stop:690 length:312 start_codon:yes stop_codon:yes gene_type:complete
MSNHQIKLFRAIINQAIHDAMYDGVYKYHIIDKREAIQWLTSDSIDFRTICSYAEIDASQATRKFTEAMKLDLYALRDDQNLVLNKPRKKYKHKGKFRLTFNE